MYYVPCVENSNIIKTAIPSQNSQEFNPKSGLLAFKSQKKGPICSGRGLNLEGAVIDLSNDCSACHQCFISKIWAIFHDFLKGNWRNHIRPLKFYAFGYILSKNFDVSKFGGFEVQENWVQPNTNINANYF